MRLITRSVIVVGLALLLTACLTNDNSNLSRFSLHVTDAPVDGAKSVVLQFSGVEMRRAKGTETINFTAPKQIDLMLHSRGRAATLVDYVEIPAGDYQWVRLKVDAVAGLNDSYIVLADDSLHELQIPSDAVADLTLVSPFTLTAGDSENFTIDFDLRKSIQQTAEGYVLRPALRMVEDKLSGTIQGNVDPDFLIDASCASGAAVYVYSGTNATPTDISGTVGGPFASSNVELSWYTLAFLPAGAYTVALTCDGELDEPDQVDALTFLSQSNVNVLGGRNVTYLDFIPE